MKNCFILPLFEKETIKASLRTIVYLLLTTVKPIIVVISL